MTPAELPERLAAAGHRELARRIRLDHPVAALTTYRVGGAAAAFIVAEQADDLVRLGRTLGRSPVRVVVLGRGSNVLIGERGISGLVVQLGDGFAMIDATGANELEPGEVDTSERVEVTAGGAALLPVVARKSVAGGLAGFEWAVGVPGSIGGAVRMNAGGHGSDMAASLHRVRVIDLAGGEDEVMAADTIELGYRHSNLRAAQVVVSATLLLERGDRARSESELAEIVRWRRDHQPGGQNAGSVFRNPGGSADSAGALIDQAGCRGLRIGSAEVSTKHANFMQVDPNGRADDVVVLMAAVRERVRQHCGVSLIAETHVFGVDRDTCEAAGAVWRDGGGT